MAISDKTGLAYKEPIARPRSAVAGLTGWLGLLGLFFGIWIAVVTDVPPAYAFIPLILFSWWPMMLLEIIKYRPWRSADAGLNWELNHRQINRGEGDRSSRVYVKLFALLVAWGALALWFRFLPYYSKPEFPGVLRIVGVFALFGIAMAVPYFHWIERHLQEPWDSAWHAGALLLRLTPMTRKFIANGPRVESKKALDFFLGWFIKAFFFVFLASALPSNIAFLQKEVFDPLESLYRFMYLLTTLLFTVDIVLALVGYLCTTRLLNAHIRSTNDQWLGWISAMSCYPPFTFIGGVAILDYRVGGTYWDLWLAQSDFILPIWAAFVFGALLIYIWATVAFGFKFSNLTNRGILTHGPYRLTRHPAYLAKNCYWWLIYVPWINSQDTQQAVINCVLMAALSGVYYLRAKTEERHLMADEDYRAYVSWFESHTLWQRIRAK